MYSVTKTYGHGRGLSCCFRQPGAKSHCRYLHGYSLSFSFTFSAEELDENNWVIDFGALKEIEEWLKAKFDHRTIVSLDDPYRGWLENAATLGIIDICLVPKVGCEAFAEMAANKAEFILEQEGLSPRVRLSKVTVAEHESNSATYYGLAISK